MIDGALHSFVKNGMVSLVVSMIDGALHSFVVTSLNHLVTHLQEEVARKSTDEEKEYMQENNIAITTLSIIDFVRNYNNVFPIIHLFRVCNYLNDQEFSKPNES